MKRTITYIITIILSITIGCALMYGLIYFYPNTIIDTVSTVETKVTVNDNGISDGIKNVYDAVVTIENYQKGKLAGFGSGFIYDEEGYVMTNHHVIESSDEIKIILSNEEVIGASLIGSDEYADIAVLKIDKKYVTKVASIKDASNANIGDTVFTIGSPISINYAGTVTRGILSGKNRMVEVSVSSSSNDWIMNVMQTDAAINPGNSGGPLCNVNGDVIGINSLKLVQEEVEGLGFAIPIEDALFYAKKIVNKEEIKRSYLGIEMADIYTSSNYLKRQGINIDSSITSGVVVVNPISNGPCDISGIKSGDVITKIGEYNVNTVAELRYYLYKYEPNTTIKIEVIRGTAKKTFSVTLGTSD